MIGIRKNPNKKFRVLDKMEDKVGLLKITTNMFPEQFEFYSKNKFKGIVIEGTGLGHAPGFVSDKNNEVHKKLWKALAELAKNSVVVMTTQTLYGRVHMHVYDKGVELQKLGIIPGKDMLPETALLSWRGCLEITSLKRRGNWLERISGER